MDVRLDQTWQHGSPAAVDDIGATRLVQASTNLRDAPRRQEHVAVKHPTLCFHGDDASSAEEHGPLRG